jgi:hypothetical protein
MTRSFILGSILSVALVPGVAMAGGENKGDKTSGKGKTTLTGCLSQGSQDGSYTLKTKAQTKDVEVKGLAHLKDHVGHEVKLTGEWMEGSHAGEAKTETSGSTGTKETARTDKGADKHFMVSDIQHIAASCTTGQAKP